MGAVAGAVARGWWLSVTSSRYDCIDAAIAAASSPSSSESAPRLRCCSGTPSARTSRPAGERPSALPPHQEIEGRSRSRGRMRLRESSTARLGPSRMRYGPRQGGGVEAAPAAHLRLRTDARRSLTSAAHSPRCSPTKQRRQRSNSSLEPARRLSLCSTSVGRPVTARPPRLITSYCEHGKVQGPAGSLRSPAWPRVACGPCCVCRDAAGKCTAAAAAADLQIELQLGVGAAANLDAAPRQRARLGAAAPEEAATAAAAQLMAAMREAAQAERVRRAPPAAQHFELAREQQLRHLDRRLLQSIGGRGRSGRGGADWLALW